MKEITRNLYLGSKDDLILALPEIKWAYVHASKNFYDQFADKVKNEMTSSFLERNNHLYLDWVDQENMNLFKLESFIKAMDFVDKWIKTRKVLVHCDHGQSRSPTLVMLHLAKRKHKQTNYFFSEVALFKKIYPDYFFPSGVSKFVKANWNELC